MPIVLLFKYIIEIYINENICIFFKMPEGLFLHEHFPIANFQMLQVTMTKVYTAIAAYEVY